MRDLIVIRQEFEAWALSQNISVSKVAEYPGQPEFLKPYNGTVAIGAWLAWQHREPADRATAMGAGALPAQASYWMVESTNGCGWWDGRCLGRGIDPRFFTHDPNESVRFARKEDAERVCDQSSALKATEHAWIDRAPASGAAGQKDGAA